MSLKKITPEFIELFLGLPLLWDPSQRLYQNRELRTAAVKELALKCDFSVDEVGKMIKALQRSYKEEVNKANKSKSSGAGAFQIYKPRAFWFDEYHSK